MDYRKRSPLLGLCIGKRALAVFVLSIDTVWNVYNIALLLAAISATTRAEIKATGNDQRHLTMIIGYILLLAFYAGNCWANGFLAASTVMLKQSLARVWFIFQFIFIGMHLLYMAFYPMFLGYELPSWLIIKAMELIATYWFVERVGEIKKAKRNDKNKLNEEALSFINELLQSSETKDGRNLSISESLHHNEKGMSKDKSFSLDVCLRKVQNQRNDVSFRRNYCHHDYLQEDDPTLRSIEITKGWASIDSSTRMLLPYTPAPLKRLARTYHDLLQPEKAFSRNHTSIVDQASELSNVEDALTLRVSSRILQFQIQNLYPRCQQMAFSYFPSNRKYFRYDIVHHDWNNHCTYTDA